MSTVVEIKDLYHGILSKYVNKEIIPDIMMYIRIIAKYECETCCNKNCKKLHIDMLKCVTQNNGTHKCHELIEKWRDCRTTEKILLNSFYDKTFKTAEK